MIILNLREGVMEPDDLLELPVERLMHRKVVAIDAQEVLETAAALMLARQVRHLPVVEEGVLVGILSDGDVTRRLGASLRDFAHAGTQLQDVVANAMTPDPIVLRPETSLRSALHVFADERVGAIPIVDEGERLLGILSYVDVLGWLEHLHGAAPDRRGDLPAEERATRQVTGEDAPPAQATFGSTEPARGQEEEEEMLGVAELEPEPSPNDISPDHIETVRLRGGEESLEPTVHRSHGLEESELLARAAAPAEEEDEDERPDLSGGGRERPRR